MEISAPVPLSLYVHVPWCVRKCPYCDFNSHPLQDRLEAEAYLQALLADLDYEAALVPGRCLNSIFIGGGTPSLVPSGIIARLLQQVRLSMDCGPELEITLEANPGTVDAGRFAGYLEAGVNRLSIGVQSFDAGSLKALGRIHDPGQAKAAVALARHCGFDNINLDLMFGLPDQTLAMAEQDVATAIELRPRHISHYQLTLEPNTAFHHAPPALPEEDSLWEMQRAGHLALSAAGYRQYEVSAFCQPGGECRHNLNYWQFGDYLGIGAGAHGKLTDPDRAWVVRRRRVRDPQRYLETAGRDAVLSGENQLTSGDLVFEFMLNALRLEQGFTDGLFRARTGLSLGLVQRTIDTACDRGLLRYRGGRVRPTALGKRFLNDLTAIFLPSDD